MAISTLNLLGTTALTSTVDKIATAATPDNSESSIFQLTTTATQVATNSQPDASDEPAPDAVAAETATDDDDDSSEDTSADATADQDIWLTSQQPSTLQYLLQDQADNESLPVQVPMPVTEDGTTAAPTGALPLSAITAGTAAPTPPASPLTTSAMASTATAGLSGSTTTTDTWSSSLTESVSVSVPVPAPHKPATSQTATPQVSESAADVTGVSLSGDLLTAMTATSNVSAGTNTTPATTDQVSTPVPVTTPSVLNALTTLTTTDADTGTPIDSDPYSALSSLSGSSSASQLSQWLNTHTTADTSGSKTTSGQTQTNTQGTSVTGNSFMYSQTNYTMSADLASTATTDSTMQAAGEKMLNLLQQQVSLQLTQQTQQATIRLDPPHLGQLDIVVKTEGDKLTVQINAEHAAVRESLENSREQLRQVLMPDHQGGVDVEIGQGSSSAQQQQQTIELWDDESISTASSMPSTTGDTSDSIPESTTSNSDWLNTVV